MSALPEALRRLDVLTAAQRIAHETIYDLHDALASAGHDRSKSAELLGESSRVAIRDAFAVTSAMRRLSGRWHEQSVLDPVAAEETASALEAELARVEPQLLSILNRQREIAAELRALLHEGS